MNVVLQSVTSFVNAATGKYIEADQLIYFISMYTSLIGAYIVKNKLHFLSLTYRLYLIGFFGLWIYYTMWGWIVILPFTQAILSFFMLLFLPPDKSTRYIFIFAMSFLSLCHIYVLYVQLNSLVVDITVDFTGSIMIMTQRITSLAYSIKDGMTKTEEKLDDFQKKYAVRQLPSFPEYFAYMFSFTGIMCGPFAFYNDVIPHLKKHGTSVKKSDESSAVTPSAGKAVFIKISLSMFFIYLYWVGTTSYPCRRNIDMDFITRTPLIHRFMYLYISLFLSRAKYYGAWLFGDAVHNAMGIGHNGLDKNGRAKWDLISNINIINIEFATGLKMYIDNWNIMTVRWIRYVSYTRASPKHRTIASFLLSALWHGFFPGYYIMFLTCHAWLLTQRKARRLIRPWFQSGTFLRSLYDVTTWLFTQLGIAYAVVPFVVLEWSGSIRFYKSIGFVGHVIGFAVYLLLSLSSRFVNSKGQNGVVKSEKENGFHPRK